MKRFVAIACLGTLLYPLSAVAETPEAHGLTIAVEADQQDNGWVDSTANLTMILRNRHGQESTRTIRSKSLEVKGDGDKRLSIFDNPRDVAGTAMLTFSHKLPPDDQWLYLPALKRVKRISSRNKSGSFMGSEFSFEDLGSQEVEQYTYKYLRDEELDGRPCFVIERYPVDKYSGYKRQVVWIDQARYQPLKVEYYDRKDAHLKTLTSRGYHQYLGHYWRPDEMEMVNHQNHKSTLLKWENYRFHIGLTKRDFDRNSLKRAR